MPPQQDPCKENKRDEIRYLTDLLIRKVWQGDEARRGLAEQCASVVVAGLQDYTEQLYNRPTKDPTPSARLYGYGDPDGDYLDVDWDRWDILRQIPGRRMETARVRSDVL